MPEDFTTGFITALLLVGVLTFYVLASDTIHRTSWCEQNNVRLGHAEWITLTNGTVEWRWKTNCFVNTQP